MQKSLQICHSLVRKVEEINGTVQPGRFLNAKDLGRQEEGADFKWY